MSTLPWKQFVCILVLAASGCSRSERRSLAAAPQEDHYELYPKSGRLYNASQEERRMAEAKRILKQIEASLPKKTDEELFTMFNLGEDGNGVFAWVFSGVDYYVARDLNEMIIEELRRRGGAARMAMIAHRDDPTPIFLGTAGPRATISSVCEDILAEIQEPPAAQPAVSN